MNKFLNVFIVVFALASIVKAQPIGGLPDPEFQQVNFLRMAEPERFCIDYALQWTDSMATVFLQPMDAVVLHIEFEGTMRDVFIISDAGMNRLTVWQCTEPDGNGERELYKAIAYYGDTDIDGDTLLHPAGLATNAINRKFDPDQDFIYVADRGNDRILELTYTPDSQAGVLTINRVIGEGELEWPIDVAVSAYGNTDWLQADLYVVELGHIRDNGKLKRFDLYGNLEGAWRDLTHPGFTTVIRQITRPVSVACFPDTIENNTAIYITDAYYNTTFYLTSHTEDSPTWVNGYDLEIRTDFFRPGGIALDDYGRIYVANEASGIIEKYGPYINYVYDAFGELGEEPGQFYYPRSISIDTYHPDVCEALILECMDRKSGLQSYLIEGGWSPEKPPLGFIGAGLPKPSGDRNELLPAMCSLGDAYPNPFNAQCIISYSIPEQTKVRIDVFNILGQKVETLLDDTQEAGEHSVVFDAGSISSGIYFYRLKTDNYTQSKSMVLLK